MRKRKPTTPGEILQDEFLKPLDLSQKELAECIGCDYKIINGIVNEREKITLELAVQLSIILKTTPDFWLNAQRAIDVWRTQTH